MILKIGSWNFHLQVSQLSSFCGVSLSRNDDSTIKIVLVLLLARDRISILCLARYMLSPVRPSVCYVALIWYQDRWPWITLNCYKFEFSENFARFWRVERQQSKILSEFGVISRFWETPTAKRVKITPKCLRQNYCPLGLNVLSSGV